MLDPLLWYVVLGPLALAAVGIWPGGSAAARNRLAMSAAALTLTLALITALFTALGGAMRTTTFGMTGLGLEISIDRLSATMLCLVSFVGLIVVAYSRNYLNGDPGQSRFTRYLCLTLAAILFVIVSGNGVAFTAAWMMSLFLHQLLVFYPDRPAAVIAARKKFIASRLSDLCLIVAMITLPHVWEP